MVRGRDLAARLPFLQCAMVLRHGPMNSSILGVPRQSTRHFPQKRDADGTPSIRQQAFLEHEVLKEIPLGKIR
jgi:hypothetical protein